MKPYYLIPCLFIVATSTLFAQEQEEDPYAFLKNSYYTVWSNLNFNLGGNLLTPWKIDKPYPNRSVDSTEMINGKYPLKLGKISLYSNTNDISDRMRNFIDLGGGKPPKNEYYPFEFNLYQAIKIPMESCEDSVSVELDSKSLNMQNAVLIVDAYDKYDKRFFSDSVSLLSNNEWKTNKLTFSSKERKYMHVYIKGRGIDGDLEQNMWLNQMRISIGDQNINKYPPSLEKKVPEDEDITLNKEAIIPLTLSEEYSSNILTTPIFKNPNIRIIGLGESYHGGEEIGRSAYQIMRTLIVEGNCKLVLLEISEDNAVKWNLYVRGITPITAINEIVDDISMYKFSLEETKNFLVWLRIYNANAEKQVQVFGIDIPLNSKLNLFEYLVLTGTNNIQLLQAVHDERYKDAIVYLSELKDEFVKKYSSFEYSNLQDILHRSNEALLLCEDSTSRFSYEKNFFQLRDVMMAERAENILDYHLGEDEKAVLYAHSEHLNRMINSPIWSSYLKQLPLGYFLAEKYGSQYYTIGIQTGEGIYPEDSVLGHRLTNLKDAPIGSFEYSALNTGEEYFFYPSNLLSPAISKHRAFGRNFHDVEFIESFLPNKFDGFIFIKECYPIANYMIFTSKWFSLKYDNIRKEKEHSDYLQSLQKP